jgi:uncharacterized phage protein gp47/JayE
MIDAFLSRYGLRALKVGSPVLSMLESTAQSQLRASEDIFTLLEAVSLDQAKGLALDRIGADEQVARNTESPANGNVTVSDTSFTKISSKVFQGTPAPIVGSVKINVTDASGFTASGSVYVGRGTSNYEGPLAYSSKLPPGAGFGQSGGNYWSLVLSSGTLKFHNLGESVILAQGGNRVIAPGQIVQTPQGNVVDAVQYKVRYSATIPDGETEVQGVAVTALKPGTIGNVIANAISGFAQSPFNGAAVSNPTPFTNGLPSESDDSYRERIRQARQSRTRGTALALQVFSIGVVATDENKRVLSANTVTRQGEPTVLVIDDGTGYEERSEGVAIESLVDLAFGGEKFRKIASRPPVTKAYLLSTESAPFTLSGGQQLAATVGGVTTVHTFDLDEFRSIGNASAYEVVASINGDPALNWSARTYNSGTQVAVFAKADTNESIQIVPVADSDGVIVDANAFMGFPSGRADTMRLYKNDRLLSKDGEVASITSNSFDTWATLTGSQDLELQVDGAPMANLAGGTYTFTAQDFIDAETGFTAMGRNTAEAWAEVFNYRIPGITATVVNGRVVITSNRLRSGRAKLAVLGGTLVTQGMFDVSAVTVTGVDSDYTLNRNTGEIELARALAAGDRLTAGSASTRAFLQSQVLGTVTVLAGDAHFWFVVDGNASIVNHGLTASTPITFTASATAWGFRVRATGTSGMFTNVQSGDWVIFWDSSSPAALKAKSYRVQAVDTSTASWFEIDRAVTYTGAGIVFSNSGVSFIRTQAEVQKLVIAAGTNYTAASATPLFSAGLVGVDALTYQTMSIRVNTSSFAESVGDIALVAADTEAQKFKLPVANATVNNTGHLASTESGDADTGTPDFSVTSLSTTAPRVSYAAGDAIFTSPSPEGMWTDLRPEPIDGTFDGRRYGNNQGHVTSLGSVTDLGGSVFGLVERLPPLERLVGDRSYFASPYALAGDDMLTMVVDGDTSTKRFAIPMWRTLKPTSTTYAAQNEYVDADNGDQSLAIGFGYTGNNPFDFNDFAIMMAARAKTHDQGDSSTQAGGVLANLNKTVLWRWYKLGPDGEHGRVRYVLPQAPDADVAVSIDNLSNKYSNVSISLKGGAQRTGYNLDASARIAVTSLAPASGMSTVYYILGYPIASASRTTNVTTLTLTLPAGVTNSGLPTTSGVLLYVTSTSGSFSSGAKQLLSSAGATVTYAEVAADQGATANIGSIAVGSVAASFAGASIAVGDICHIGTNVTVPNGYAPATFRIKNNVASNPNWLEGSIDDFPVNDAGVVSIAPVGDPSDLKIYQNSTQTVATIVAAVNALIADNPSIPVRPTLIGNGSGTIDRSSSEDLATSASWKLLTDGLNWVQTTVDPVLISDNYELLFKQPINAALATNSDWINEVVRVVPRTAKNVVDWLNQPTVSGLFSVSDIERSSRGRKVQVVSLTPGSAGSIEVQGGTSNSATAAVLGSAQDTAANNCAVVTVAAADADGFMAGAWTTIDNTNTVPRAVFNSGTILNSIAADGPVNFRLSFSTAVYNLYEDAASVVVAVERQGAFIAVHDSGLGGALNLGSAVEGDWVRVKAPAAVAYSTPSSTNAIASINPGNSGIFRIVRVHDGTIWIENASAVVQPLAECDIQLFTNDSVMPGDVLQISTLLWKGDNGLSNNGTYQIVDVGDNGGGSFTSTTRLTVIGPMNVVTTPASALGSSLSQAQVIEGTPTRLLKKIAGIAPNSSDSDLVDIKFTSDKQFGRIGAASGSILTALDKLEFGLGIAKGLDGYQHSVGLIGEVNRVIYGDVNDRATYPGVASAGAKVNIEGALVKRVQLTISLRLKSGASRTEITDRVKSAIAAVVNKADVGESVSLSDIVTAAGKVGGVVTATMVNPLATASSDQIPVQPYERPRVLNVDQDVTVTFVGE